MLFRSLSSSSNTGSTDSNNTVITPPTTTPEVEVKPEVPPIVESLPVIGTGTIINFDLNVRKEAKTSSDILGVIAKGSKVEIVEEANGWSKIKYGTDYGYVYTKHIEMDKEEDKVLPELENVIYTSYDYTLDEMIAYQINKLGNVHDYDYMKSYIDVNLENANPLMFLRIDTFKAIDAQKLANLLMDKGVLNGMEYTVLDACKTYSLDPVYFVSQSLHETGMGTSVLSSGVEISQIADESKPIYDDEGELIGYEMIDLDESVIVYNLFGIDRKSVV